MGELDLTENARVVLMHRYLRKDSSGRIIEKPEEMFERVARWVSRAEEAFGGSALEWRKRFQSVMKRLEFLPNSPTLMNAGTDIGQLSACFVLPVPDSISGIFKAVRDMAVIHKSGGGTGFSFSSLRPKSDVVSSTGGVASGPVSFMRIFDSATDVIKQGGRRRGANMGILRVDHPDIVDFIRAKADQRVLRNFNLSVAVSDIFFEKVAARENYELVNPRSGEVVAQERADRVFEEICRYAWMTGEPGMIFLDEVNRHNPTPEVGAIEATNPCGEQPLLPYESCNLGSVNLARVVAGNKIDWEKLARLVEVGVRFLDDVIEVNSYPLPEIERLTKGNRKIGLGVMGFAEMLIRLGIPYDSPGAVELAEKLMRFIGERAHSASRALARERSSFPNFDKSIWRKKGYDAMRNATTTTIAPTGTISIIAGTTSGIEPLFAVCYFRRVLGGKELLEVNPLFEEVARKRGFYSSALAEEISRSGRLGEIKAVPEDVRALFATALDISAAHHIRIQAAFQKHTDNAVSKTVNLPADATVEDVKQAYLLAHRLKCKGVAVYRYGTRKQQVLSLGMPEEGRPFPAEELPEAVRVGSEYTGECRICSV